MYIYVYIYIICIYIYIYTCIYAWASCPSAFVHSLPPGFSGLEAKAAEPGVVSECDEYVRGFTGWSLLHKYWFRVQGFRGLGV